ncbi:MAG: TolC family protein [Planctomycetota bacterium]
MTTGLAGAQEPKFKFTPPEKIPIPVEAGQRRVWPLTVEDALYLGQRQNIDLKVVALAPQQALEDLRIAEAFFEPEVFGAVGFRGARTPVRNTFQPSLKRDIYDAEVGWRQRVVTGGMFDTALTFANLDQSTGDPTAQFPSQISAGWAVSYTQPLLRGAWTDYTLREIHAAEAGLAGARAGYEQDTQDTLLEVVRAYWNLVFVREEYRVQYQALELAEEQLRITDERIRVRALAPRDRIADQAEVAERKEGLITAQNRIHERQDALRRLLFDDHDGEMWQVGLVPMSPIASDYDPSKLAWEVLRREARRDRPVLKDLRNQVRIAEIELMAANRDVLPQLDLTGSYDSTGVRRHSSDAWGDAVDLDFPDWSVRLEFSIPIGNNAARGRRSRAALIFEEERRRLFAQELQVDLEVRNAVRELKTWAASIKASKESVRLAESNLDTARHKWRVGELTFFDVQERNQELQEARSRHLRNQVEFRIAQTVLRHAKGKLAVPDKQPDEKPDPAKAR